MKIDYEEDLHNKGVQESLGKKSGGIGLIESRHYEDTCLLHGKGNADGKVNGKQDLVDE